MGILDDAIREHLDLKRKHGAHDADLREIEDEAFGSADRPDPFAANELFSEVSSPGAAEAGATAPPDEADAGGEDPTRLVEPEALRPTEPASEEPLSEPISPPEGISPIPGQTELPGQDEIPGQERLDDPLEGYQPSTETERALPSEPEDVDAPEPPSPSESLEELIAEEEPFPEDTAAPPPAPAVDSSAPLEPAAPVEPDVAEEEPAAEPESFVPDPPPPPPETGAEPPGRARGRIDVPTQEHPPPGETGGLPPLPSSEPELEPPSDELESPSDEEPLAESAPFAEEAPADSGGPGIFDFETDEDSLAPPSAPAEDDDFEALGPAEEEAPYLDEEEPYAEEPVSGTDLPPEEPGTEVRPALEDDEAYEGSRPDPEESYEEGEGEEGLWFEKGPPKDFDFDE
jgi:hypothetical protein